MSLCQDGTVAPTPCNVIPQTNPIGKELMMGTGFFDLRPTKAGNNSLTVHYNDLRITWQGTRSERETE